MKPAISPSSTLFVMITNKDINRFHQAHGMTAFGVLVHLMARVSLEPYRVQVRSFCLVHQWFVLMQFAELQEITGLSKIALIQALKLLEKDGWIEQTNNGYLLHDVTAKECHSA